MFITLVFITLCNHLKTGIAVFCGHLTSKGIPVDNLDYFKREMLGYIFLFLKTKTYSKYTAKSADDMPDMLVLFLK